jgi:hypothetical protein
MFSDLVGSTALSALMDPEDLREVISAYQKCGDRTGEQWMTAELCRLRGALASINEARGAGGTPNANIARNVGSVLPRARGEDFCTAPDYQPCSIAGR